MSAHVKHSRSDPPDVILHDGCPRCNEWAEDPGELDDGPLKALLIREHVADVLTNAEHRALLNIGRARLLARRVDSL